VVVAVVVKASLIWAQMGSDGLRPDLLPRHRLGSDVSSGSAWDLSVARGRPGIWP
jgi:hypothetical protein